MSYSSAASWHDVMNVLGALKNSKSGSTINFVRKLSTHVPLGVEAIDLMYHRSGQKWACLAYSSDYEIAKWLGEYIHQMKLETPDLPVVVVARSASA